MHIVKNTTGPTWIPTTADLISQGFDAGNYASAYEATGVYDVAMQDLDGPKLSAFIIGFFSSYELGEVPAAQRMDLEEAILDVGWDMDRLGIVVRKATVLPNAKGHDNLAGPCIPLRLVNEREVKVWMKGGTIAWVHPRRLQHE